MEVKPLPVFLIAAVVAAGAAALLSRNNDGGSSKTDAPPASVTAEPNPHGSGMLPPNHPPIGSAGGMGMGMGSPNEAPAIAWTAPSSFTTAPNTSGMRLATYKIAPAAGDTDEAELSVIRAGGSTEANLDRWVRQFDDAGKETKTEKTVAGFKVTLVEVSGTYLGGGMSPIGAPEPKKGWSLLGAIVETSGSAYFFKMTGPTATVKKAHDPFVAMIEGITKV